MTPTIPVTPARRALNRVLRLSKVNGWSIVVIAGAGTLVSLLLGDLASAGTGALATGAGVMELRGRRRLQRRDATGVKLLVRAELFLLAVIAVYAVSRLASFDAGYLKEQVIPELKQNLLLFGVNLDELLQQFEMKVDDIVPLVQRTFYALYGGVLLTTIFYQGGLAWWYGRRTDLVEQALTEPPLVGNRDEGVSAP
ncbi:MAG: hypothetical protein ACHQ5A_09805 [Opitutales bacterium]